MAECIPTNHQIRTGTKRQDDSVPCHENVSTTIGTKEERKGQLRNFDNFQVLVEENMDESGIKDFEKMTFQLDMEVGSLVAMTSLEGENDKKNAKMKSDLFWQKMDNHKSSNRASPVRGSERNEQYAEGACAMPLTNESQSAALASHPQPRSSAVLRKREPRQSERTEEKDVMQENSRQVAPKTLKQQQIPEQNIMKHENSALWNTQRILPNCPRPKAVSCDQKPAKEPQKHLETHEAGPCTEELTDADDAQDTTDLLNESEHTCAICYDIMVRPHEVRPCGHVFCELCLRQLQSTTASRQPLQHPQVERNGRQQREILVLCPICRRPIEKCHAKGELNDFVRAKYPQGYSEGLKLLHDETRKSRNSRLPSSRPGQYRQLHQNHRHGPVQNQQLPDMNKVGEILRNFGWILFVCGAGSVLALYFVSMIITVGLLKFCFACVGKGGLVFDKEREDARSPLSFRMMQVLSFVLFLVGVKMFFTLCWWQLIVLNLLVLFLMSMGYSLDGRVEKTVFKVVTTAFRHLGRA